MDDRTVQWMSMALLIGVLALAVAGALRWDVLKLWWRSLFMPQQEPHLTLQQQPTDRHRHTHRNGHASPD